jgi:hypothetical protein
MSVNLLLLRLVSIRAQSMPWAEGTGGLFIAEGGKTEKLNHPNTSLLKLGDNVLAIDLSHEKFEVFVERRITEEPDIAAGLAVVPMFEMLVLVPVRCEDNVTSGDKEEGKENPAANKERQKAQAVLDEFKRGKESTQHLLPGHFDSLDHLGEPHSEPCCILSTLQRWQRR